MRLIAIYVLLTVLSGCASKPIEVLTTPVERPSLDLPPPDAVRLNPVQWHVITPENSAVVFSSLKKSPSDQVVLFGITPESYKNLSVNFAEVTRYITEQRNINNQYRVYCDKPPIKVRNK